MKRREHVSRMIEEIEVLIDGLEKLREGNPRAWDVYTDDMREMESLKRRLLSSLTLKSETAEAIASYCDGVLLISNRIINDNDVELLIGWLKEMNAVSFPE